MTARRIHITGGVQGVFFRARTVERAKELGLAGWVRNNDDGSVEIHAEGPEEKLRALEEWAKTGPAHARVEHVKASDVPEEGHRMFEKHAA